MDPVEVIMHPVRVRILRAFSGNATRTTAALCQRLAGDSQATIYRHVNALVDAGILEIVSDRRVRGAVERTYRLNRSFAAVGPDEASSMSPEDHRKAFASAMAALLADFGAYLERPEADPFSDLVGYRQIPLWFSGDELRMFVQQVEQLIDGVRKNPPSGKRREYLLSPVLFPVSPNSDPPA
jgi:DNA-binding transcriptional ArsR family regulator